MRYGFTYRQNDDKVAGYVFTYCQNDDKVTGCVFTYRQSENKVEGVQYPKISSKDNSLTSAIFFR
jgi:hypothetical protein